jgi:signal transduction histidine kinase
MERLAVLVDAALELTGEHDLDSVLTRTVARAARVAGATYAALGVYDDSGHMTRFLHEGLDDATVSAIGENPSGLGLLGEVIAADGPTRVDDIDADPRSVGFPPNHPPMRSFLGVPVQSSGRRHGNLYVTDKLGSRNFDETDEKLLGALATFAGCALDNSLLLQAERDNREAAADLAAAEASGELRQEVLAQVISAQEAERARVARDLHDQIGQSLTAMLLALQILESTTPGSTESTLRAEELRELVTDTLDDVRRLAFDLRPTVLDDIGLVTAVERLADTFRARLGLTVTVEGTAVDDRDRLPPSTETAIYRIVQEALTNVARHAGVNTARVELVFTGNTVTVEVHDDGNGFDPELKAGSLGLVGMEERAALVGGTFHITSLPGEGTTVRLEVSRG